MNENPETGKNEPLPLPRLSRRMAILGSLGAFGATGLVWFVITTIAPDFFASSKSPFSNLLVIGVVLLLFGGLIIGQIRAVRAWFASLSETDGVRRKTVGRLRLVVSMWVFISLIAGIAIFLFTQLVWMPEVRRIVGDG
ncbi:MAG: hypothetical protein CMJ34_08800 [Phycisphaerae bacterium]|nr:hypothetical protein [Phycisphaerae bacterium]